MVREEDGGWGGGRGVEDGVKGGSEGAVGRGGCGVCAGSWPTKIENPLKDPAPFKTSRPTYGKELRSKKHEKKREGSRKPSLCLNKRGRQ